MANSPVKIAKSKNDGSWWLLNATSENVELQARELFGFNVGSYAEVPTGQFRVWVRSKHCVCVCVFIFGLFGEISHQPVLLVQ